MEKIHVKFYEIWTSGSGDVIREKVYGRTHKDQSQ